MLAKFVDIEGRERWVNVEIKDNIEVREGPRRVVFIHEDPRGGGRGDSNPSRMPDELAVVKVELDGRLKKNKNKKVHLPIFIRGDVQGS
jgi:hypothetical protein